jgi:hypothetical protein
VSPQTGGANPRPGIVTLFDDIDALVGEKLMPFLRIADMGHLFTTSKVLQRFWTAR